ncbi:MAG: glycine--tRNA ligase subunit beta [Thermodesulfobacteriota bacterium]
MTELDLLVEVGTEEIPAGYMTPALAALEERLIQTLAEVKLPYRRLATWSTPRRLALAVWGLTPCQPDTVQEITGPPLRAAFDSTGQPTKAALGFARAQGVDVSRLATIETAKGSYLAVRKEIKGRPASEVLAEVMPPLILGLPFPKSMRWGRGNVTFVRPIHWLLAVLDGRALPMTLGDIQAGRFSRGHRFLGPGPIEINSPDDYEKRLADYHVVASFERRRELVRREILRVAAETGLDLKVLSDDDLVDEVANLVEEPVAVLGGFDESFLQLPQDVLITAMREHQRYFALTEAQGRLAAFFVAVNNTRARDLAVVRRGHERVLRARLEDARFYFDEDRKTSLASKAEALKEVVYHSLLGTSWQKVERFTALAEYLADRLAPAAKKSILEAGRLCKCDLVSGVVGQFPSLQGIMGREYARLDGWPEEVAQAIYEHYWPTRADGDLPTTTTGAVLSLADKMDTIAGCFGVGLIPTGAADPYALRRQALGVINIILNRKYRLSLAELIEKSLTGLSFWLNRPAGEVKAEVLEFIRLRIKNQLTGRGVSADGAEAVLSLYHDDLVSAEARVQALEEFRKRPDFDDLAVAFKRVVNIIKKFGAHHQFDQASLAAKEERTLKDEIEKLENQYAQGAEDFARLLEDLASIKPAVDSFFDHVLVDDPNPVIKANRLALLTRLVRMFELVADFSKISA